MKPKSHWQAFLWIVGGYGTVSTITGLLTGDVLFIVTAIGAVGFCGFILGFLLWWFVTKLLGTDDDDWSLLGPCFLIGAIPITYWIITKPNELDANGFTFGTFCGLVVIAIAFFIGVNLYNNYVRSNQPPPESRSETADSLD